MRRKETRGPCILVVLATLLAAVAGCKVKTAPAAPISSKGGAATVAPAPSKGAAVTAAPVSSKGGAATAAPVYKDGVADAPPVFVPPKWKKTGQPPLLQNNIIVILDASGSMRSPVPPSLTRMQMAQAALWEVLKKLPEDTHVGFLVFGAKNLEVKGKTIRWVYPLAPRDNATLQKAINHPQPYYGTFLGMSIKVAADRLLEQRTRQKGYGTYRLVIVTDGEANDSELLEKYVPEVLARGIRIDVVGVCMKAAHTLATKVHSYRSADDLESCKKALGEAVAEAGNVAADAASDEAFKDIAPLPGEMIKALLKALCENLNHPISEKPKKAASGGL